MSKLKAYHIPLAAAAGIGGVLVARIALPKMIRTMGLGMGQMMEYMPDE